MTRRFATVLFALFGVLAFILFRALLFMPHFMRLRKYLKMEIGRSPDEDERKYWKRELRKLYLCFIPFITVNNVNVFFRRK